MKTKPSYQELEEEINSLNKKLKEKDSQNSLQNFFRNNKAIMLKVNFLTKQIIDVNNAATKFYGYTRKEFLTKTIFDIHTLSKTDICKLMKNAINQKSNIFHFKHRLANGKIKAVDVFSSPIDADGDKIMLITVVDISEHIKQRDDYFSLYEDFRVQNKELLISKLRAEENEIKFRNILDNTKVQMWAFDGTKYIYMNKEWFRFMGQKPVENPSINIFESALHPDDVDNVMKNWKEKFELRKEHSTTYRLRRHDGVYRTLYGYATPIFDEKQNFKYFQGFSIDITEQKSAESSLLESEKKYKNIIENLTDIYYRTDINGIIVMASPSCLKAFGYTYLHEVIGQPISLLYKAENGRNKFIKQLKTTGKIHNYSSVLLRKDGSKIHVETNANMLFDSQGNYAGVEGIVRDISERKEAEISLKESEKHYRLLFENSPLAIYTANPNGTILDTNKTLLTLLGSPSIEETKKINILKFQPLQKVGYSEKFIDVCKTGKTITFESVYKTRWGKLVYFSSSIFPFINEKGEITKIYTVMEDVSDRKKWEIKLLKAKEKAEESNRLKTEFINNMSHEIRTPMNGILGFSQLLEDIDENENKETQKEYITIIKNSSNQLMRIIDDIIEISKLGTKQVKAINSNVCINDLLNEQFLIFNIKAKENNIPLYLKNYVANSQSILFTDKSKLNKIVSNLLENALKFTSKGFIEFGCKTIEIEKNKWLEIYVKDTGVGIKEKNLKIIFDRFSQEEKDLSQKVGGLGLGLSIAKENVELLGGIITVESVKGRGTTFFVRIPITEPNESGNNE